MIGPLVDYTLSFAHGWAAALTLLAVFYVAGFLLTPQRWQHDVRWPDEVVLGLALYAVLCWIAVSSRNIPIVYVALAYAGVTWALASFRPRVLQTTLATRVRSRAARRWVAGFSVLYALAFVLMRPAVGAAFLPLAADGNVDLVTYARYARQLLSAGTANADLAPFEYLRSPASSYMLAGASLFFRLDPLNAAMTVLFLQVSLFGMIAAECARSVFGLSRVAAMAIAAIVVSATVTRWLLASYALAELLAATVVFYLLTIAARTRVRGARKEWALGAAAAGGTLLVLAAPPWAGWVTALPEGVSSLLSAVSFVSLLGSPSATPPASALSGPIRSAAVVALAVVPLFWAGIVSGLGRSSAHDRVMRSDTDRRLGAALVVYVGVALIIGNIAVQLVRGPAPVHRPASWRRLAEAGDLPFGSMTLKVADEAGGLSTALAMYYLPGRRAEVFGRGVSLQALPYDGVSKQHPMFIQNFRCDGVGHADAVFVAGVGCLLLAPPGMTPGQSYPFNQTFLFLDYDRMTAREPGGRWNTRPTLRLRVMADPQRAGLDRPVFVNFLVNPFLPEGVKPQRLAMSWGSGRQGQTQIAEREWFSLPVGSGDWTGNRLWTLPIRIDFLDGRTILFHELALTESPRGQVVGGGN